MLTDFALIILGVMLGIIGIAQRWTARDVATLRRAQSYWVDRIDAISREHDHTSARHAAITSSLSRVQRDGDDALWRAVDSLIHFAATLDARTRRPGDVPLLFPDSPNAVNDPRQVPLDLPTLRDATGYPPDLPEWAERDVL